MRRSLSARLPNWVSTDTSSVFIDVASWPDRGLDVGSHRLDAPTEAAAG
jgi:hypothetical protein